MSLNSESKSKIVAEYARGERPTPGRLKSRSHCCPHEFPS